MVHLRHFLIRNKRKKFGLIFTAIVCYGLRAASTSLLTHQSPQHESSAHVKAHDSEDPHGEQAFFTKSLPFPFELVHDTWENGPQDVNLIRVDVDVSHSGSEEVKRKMIYTKNPLPFILRKTIVRAEQFVFQEEQHIDMRKKYSKLWSINRSYEDTVQARRSFTLREDPQRKGWTIMEQTLSVSISTSLGGAAMTKQLEKIARGTFMSGCETSIADLEKTLAQKHREFKLRGSRGAGSDQANEELELAVEAADASMRKHTLRRMAEFTVSRGLVLAGAALRIWAHIKAPHHTCPRELEPGQCHAQATAATDSRKARDVNLKEPAPQALPAHRDQGPVARNPIKRMMSVAAAAFVSV